MVSSSENNILNGRIKFLIDNWEAVNGFKTGIEVKDPALDSNGY